MADVRDCAMSDQAGSDVQASCTVSKRFATFPNRFALTNYFALSSVSKLVTLNASEDTPLMTHIYSVENSSVFWD